MIQPSYRVFHNGEEEKRSYVTKTVDVLMDYGEGLPQVLCSFQD